VPFFSRVRKDLCAVMVDASEGFIEANAADLEAFV
jgi:hypothetical protein